VCGGPAIDGALLAWADRVIEALDDYVRRETANA
jgi:hypothetical protein